MSFSDAYPINHTNACDYAYPIPACINNDKKQKYDKDNSISSHDNYNSKSISSDVNITINRSTSLCDLVDYQKKLFNENKNIITDISKCHHVIINQQTMIENLQSQLNIMIPKLESINDNIYNLNIRYNNDLIKVKNKCYQDSLFNKGYISEFEQRFDHVDDVLQDLDQEVELLMKNKI